MTGRELFEAETAMAFRDRVQFGPWEKLPRRLQDWWNDQADAIDPQRHDWNSIKAAVR